MIFTTDKEKNARKLKGYEEVSWLKPAATKDLLAALSKEIRRAQTRNNRRKSKASISVHVIEIEDVLYQMRLQLGWLRRSENRLRNLEKRLAKKEKPQNKMAGRNRLRV